jgi:superfamily II DNA or RNA helicase
MTFEEFFQTVQKACLPGVWSKGVAFARDYTLIESSRTTDEIIFMVQIPNRPVCPKVTLWIEEQDWHCDCGDRNDPCAHIAAAVITLKSPKPENKPKDKPKDRNESFSHSLAPRLSYRFFRKNGDLTLERWIGSGQSKERLIGSLVSYSGGIQSGRIASRPIAATREDYAVDLVLGNFNRALIESSIMSDLLTALERCSDVLLDGLPISVFGKPALPQALITKKDQGFCVRIYPDSTVTEIFNNAAVLCGNTLRPLAHISLSSEEREMASKSGKFFPQSETGRLVGEVLPSLRSKLAVNEEHVRLPKLCERPPRIVINLDSENDGSLYVLPALVYDTAPDEISYRDKALERQLFRKLQSELNLQPGQRIRLQGEEAVDFTLRLHGWDVKGKGRDEFSLALTLTPQFQISGANFEVNFESRSAGFAGANHIPGAPNTPDGSHSIGTPHTKRTLNFNQVYSAWQQGARYLPLSGGGWAPLPNDWLKKYGKRISALLAARDAEQKLPSYFLPELTEVCTELGHSYPDPLKALRDTLQNLEGIPEAMLPHDLCAELRHYQKKGIDWLMFLRQNEMGALLADDMGLGKTLQALCVIRGRTLVVSPTSVLHGWTSQIEQFRPGLKFGVYHGSPRKLDPDVEITLTTYAILRLDRETLTREAWDTIILDEAQTIKNPDSQIAQAAHQLKAKFRIALSGTPIENRLDDLWSQSQFLNPGLLGSRATFQEEFSVPISRGDPEAAKRLRNRMRPFLLRRLKSEVAKELPPRTESVLECELNNEELEVYQSILAASREEVLQHLQSGGSVFGAFEMLLRLRQACCHIGLIPGQKAESSSKVELLLETLETSQAEGHRSLIFSQWTSYLDLIEPHLKSAGIEFLRLDGSTMNRQEIVSQFQNESGPPVLLMSLKAGGVGLNLTAADHVFILDPWWNPAAEDQAADRAHRIGQTRPVMIHRLVAQGTIEERILALQKQKLELAKSVLEDAGKAVSLSREDLLFLLKY